MGLKSRNRLTPLPSLSKGESSAPFPLSLQGAVHQTVHSSSTPAKDISKKLGICYQGLTNGANKNLGFRFSAKHILPLMQETKNFVILYYLARECGFSVFKLPEGSPRGNLLLGCFDLQDCIGILAKKTKEFFSANCADKKLAEEIDLAAWLLICSASGMRKVLQNKNQTHSREGAKP